MKKILSIISASLLLALGGAWGVHTAMGMASVSLAPTKTATATTTRAWMTPGTGTTTLTLPTPLSLGVSTKYDKALLMVEADATSSAATGNKLNARVEYSLDGVDWFAQTAASSSADTTGVMSQVLAFNLATSTAYINTGANPSSSRVHQSIYIETPTPYTRVVFTDPIGGTNISLWAQIQPIKEVQVINQ